MFSATAHLVTLSVSVRDGQGRPVTGLTAGDFEVRSDGTPQSLVEFRSEPSAITAAILVDQSGSMAMAPNASTARDVAFHLVSWLQPTRDRVGLFTFDSALTQARPFATVSQSAMTPLGNLRPFGQTSLYDALDGTSEALVEDGAPRRAVVAITDGLDTTSRLTPEEVATRSAAINVPVYIVSVKRDATSGTAPSAIDPALAEIATLTGGAAFLSTTPSQMSRSARTIVDELRQQYVLAFVPTTEPGWHRLSVRTTNTHHEVRARAGYMVRDVHAR